MSWWQHNWMTDYAAQTAPAMRRPSQVMTADAFGAAFPDRLSFLRVLTRALAAERAELVQRVWEIDPRGFGHAVYEIAIAGYRYSLIAVSTPLTPAERSDRVTATAWDATFVLYDGRADADVCARIVESAPRQEAARYTARDLVLSRANRSGRLFETVVAALRDRRQPPIADVLATGYLMRTTAVYGNGKFGLADHALLADRPVLNACFAAEMLTVWMIRQFSHDLVEHLGGAALSPKIKRHLGVGNATGLGMAPFLVSHPVLLHSWIAARERALVRLRALGPDHLDWNRIDALTTRVTRHLAEWRIADPAAQNAVDTLAVDWNRVIDAWRPGAEASRHPLDALMADACATSTQTEALAAAFAMETCGPWVDDLAATMMAPIDPLPEWFETVADLKRAIKAHFSWALAIDFDDPAETARFWYISADKAEPRLGLRGIDPGADCETPVDVARRVRALYDALPGRATVRDVIAACPDHLFALHRVGLAQRYPYGELRANLVAQSCRPIDLLRGKLARFGATKFDPKSDLWTRVTLCQGAPLASDIAAGEGDDWWLAAWPG